jgi:hypothetical protein
LVRIQNVIPWIIDRAVVTGPGVARCLDRLYRNNAHAMAVEVDFNLHVLAILGCSPDGTRDVTFPEGMFSSAHGRDSLRDEPDWRDAVFSRAASTSKECSIVRCSYVRHLNTLRLGIYKAFRGSPVQPGMPSVTCNFQFGGLIQLRCDFEKFERRSAVQAIHPA